MAGAYDYSLVRGQGNNDSNWYLTSHKGSPDPDPKPDPKPAPDVRPEPGSYTETWPRPIRCLSPDCTNVLAKRSIPMR